MFQRVSIATEWGEEAKYFYRHQIDYNTKTKELLSRIINITVPYKI